MVVTLLISCIKCFAVFITSRYSYQQFLSYIIIYATFCPFNTTRRLPIFILTSWGIRENQGVKPVVVSHRLWRSTRPCQKSHQVFPRRHCIHPESHSTNITNHLPHSLTHIHTQVGNLLPTPLAQVIKHLVHTLWASSNLSLRPPDISMEDNLQDLETTQHQFQLLWPRFTRGLCNRGKAKLTIYLHINIRSCTPSNSVAPCQFLPIRHHPQFKTIHNSLNRRCHIP